MILSHTVLGSQITVFSTDVTKPSFICASLPWRTCTSAASITQCSRAEAARRAGAQKPSSTSQSALLQHCPTRSWLQSHTSTTLQKQSHQAPAIGTQLNPSSTSGISLFSPAVLQPLPGDNIYSLGEIYYLPTSSQHALNYRLACESEWVPVLAGMSRTLLHLFWIKNLKQVFVDSTLVSHALIGQERARETPTEGRSSSPQLKGEVKTFSGFYSGATHISLSSLLPRWA